MMYRKWRQQHVNKSFSFKNKGTTQNGEILRMENEKILYTKYSNDRAAPFRITTQIIERNGKKIVCKSAMEESSRSHVLAMKKHESALNEMFSGTKFKANKILASGEDFVDFEYLEGTSYDQILDGYLKNKDMDGFYSAARVFFEELDKLATVKFHESDMSKEIFGKNAFTEGEKALPIGNIDQIFQNVLVDSEGKWNVIDYEWTFDFAVPVKYIKYRSLLNLFNNQTRSCFFSEYTGYESFGITKTDAESFFNIEVNGLQKWIGNASFLNFSQVIRKPVLNPYVIEQFDYIDVFYDTGNGFSEAEKDTFYQFPIAIVPKGNLRSIRIDPSAHHCIVSDISIRAGEESLPFTTNAYMQKYNAYFFNTNDSQIYVDISRHEKSTLQFDMKVFPLDETTSATIAEQISTIMEQNTLIGNLKTIAEDFRQQLEQQIQQADLAIQTKQQEINSIYASRSWKITKPLRLMGRIARKLLR